MEVQPATFEGSIPPPLPAMSLVPVEQCEDLLQVTPTTVELATLTTFSSLHIAHSCGTVSLVR